MTFKGSSGQPGVWRERLVVDLKDVAGIAEILADHDDRRLHELMTNLAGHDMDAVREAFRGVTDDTPQCFIAYTIKGHGTPLAGHKDNHAGLMTVDQMSGFKKAMGIPEGKEWDPFAGLTVDEETAREFLGQVPFRQHASRVRTAPAVGVPPKLDFRAGETMSTQVAFGNILNELGRNDTELSRAIVTTSPDVTVSTNLGPWVNQRGIFARTVRDDAFREEKVVSAQKWQMHRQGQHIELGIAENNLFLMLASMGLSHELFGTRLMPIGTLYDPFIARGLDAMTYALYQGARFILVSTPSGITLAPEGGAHQSITTPLIGLGHPGISYFEPAYVDELEAILRWSFNHLQDPDGGSVYLRLTTRQLKQIARPTVESDVIDGAYWVKPPERGAELALVYAGAVAPEAMEAAEMLAEDMPGLGVLAVTSPSRLYADWQKTQVSGGISHLDRLLSTLAPDAPLVTVMDGHPATLSWLGAGGRAVYPLGVDRFGQSGDIQDLFRVHGIDAEAIVAAAAAALVGRLKR
jgi:pyruvate dehydrogenase E1 component